MNFNAVPYMSNLRLKEKETHDASYMLRKNEILKNVGFRDTDVKKIINYILTTTTIKASS